MFRLDGIDIVQVIQAQWKNSQWDFGLIDQNYRNISSHKDTRENRIIWFIQCLERLKELKVKTVGLPAHISCGLGGGDWTAYFQIIDNFAKANDINFILEPYPTSTTKQLHKVARRNEKLEQSDWISCHTIDISEHARDTFLKLLDDVEWCKKNLPKPDRLYKDVQDVCALFQRFFAEEHNI
ncbi:unnamed protein product [Mytilus coruscus]|uniref:Macro domain-containing protein n=1 Tax=Mytilus coruscus TaxID=42192 RepID=A0A6J8AMZ1_MYTCO|nr:unnamed protein product [Mytilus coruscus]